MSAPVYDRSAHRGARSPTALPRPTAGTESRSGSRGALSPLRLNPVQGDCRGACGLWRCRCRLIDRAGQPRKQTAAARGQRTLGRLGLGLQAVAKPARLSILLCAAVAHATEPKFVGYSVSNQVRVKIRQIDKVGEILDRLVTAGVTDIGNVEFLVSEPSKALDQARDTAIADARRKAEVYARASGVQLGRVEWITEDSGLAPPVPMRAQGASAAMAATTVPIAAGEDRMRVRVTVGFEIAR